MASAHTSGERIGDFLVKIGAMSEAQRSEVVQYQQAHPEIPFGRVAVQLGFIKDDVIDRFLESR